MIRAYLFRAHDSDWMYKYSGMISRNAVIGVGRKLELDDFVRFSTILYDFWTFFQLVCTISNDFQQFCTTFFRTNLYDFFGRIVRFLRVGKQVWIYIIYDFISCKVLESTGWQQKFERSGRTISSDESDWRPWQGWRTFAFKCIQIETYFSADSCWCWFP